MVNMRLSMTQVCLFSAILWGLLLPANYAAQKPSNISESVIVTSNCNVTGGNVTLSFGSYDPSMTNLTRDLDSTSNFSLRCTPGTSAVISMDSGQHASGATRRMVNSLGNYLEYQLYTDSSRSSVWNQSNTQSYAASTLQPRTFTVYGRVPAGQEAVLAGSYGDTITITITF